ncbi:hypothetical protein BGZ97_010507, partial [Linnemannia gamsii]
TTYICNRAHAVLNKIETKDAFRGPSKNQVLQTQHQSLYRSLLKPSRLPDSIMPNTCQLIMDSCGVMEFIRRDYERLWGKYKRLFKRSSYDECTVRVLSEMVEVEDGDSDGIDDLSSATEDPTDPLTPYDVWRLVVTKSFDELWLDSHAKVLFNLQQCQPAPQDNKQEQDHEAGRTLEDDSIDRSLRDDMSDTSHLDIAT